MSDNKTRGLTDTVLLVLLSLVISLVLISKYCYITKEEFEEAKYYCQNRKGVDRFYFHLSANKFQCSDGKTFTVRYKKLPSIFINF